MGRPKVGRPGHGPEHLARVGGKTMMLLPPSGYTADEGKDGSAPAFRLSPEWVYGYNGGTVGAVHWISDQEFVFPVAAVGIVQRLEPARQRHFIGHSGRITCLTYVSSRGLCASGQMDPKGGAGPFICIWRPSDCILLSTLVFSGHQGQICSLCFSPGGRLLFSLGRDSGHTLAVWDRFAPSESRLDSAPRELPVVFRSPSLKVPSGHVPCFGMAAAKSYVKSLFHFVIYDGGLEKQSGLLLKFFSMNANNELKSSAAIFGPPAPRHVLFCSWTAAGQCLASCDNGFLYIFEGNTATSSQRVSTSPLGFALELPDLRLVAGSRDGVLHFLPPGGGSAQSQPLRDLGGALLCSAGSMPFASASVGPALLAGSTNHHLLLIDPAKERLSQVLHVGHVGEVHAIAVHPSPEMQLFVTGSSDATVRFWDSRSHAPVVGRVLDYSRAEHWWPEGKIPTDGKGVYSLTFASSGLLLALGHGDGTLRLLSFPQLQATSVASASKQRERISSLIFVDESLLAVGCWDQLIYVFDVPGLRCLRSLRGNTSSVTQMQISTDTGFIMSNAKDGQVLFFDVRTGSRVAAPAVREQTWRRWCCPTGWPTTGIWCSHRNFGIVDVKCCTALRASTGEQLLASGDTSHCVRLYHFPAQENQGHHGFDGHAGFVTAMVPLPRDGALLEDQLITAGGDDHAVMQWSVLPHKQGVPAQSRAWSEIQTKQEPLPLRSAPALARKGTGTRKPWQHDHLQEAPEPAAVTRTRSCVSGLSDGAPPYALHDLAEEPQRSWGRRPRGMAGRSLEGGAVAGRTTHAKDRSTSLRRAVVASAAGEAGSGVSTQALSSKQSRRRMTHRDHTVSQIWQDKEPVKARSGRHVRLSLDS